MCLLYANEKFARILNKIFHPMDPKIDYTHTNKKKIQPQEPPQLNYTLNMQQELNYTTLSNLVQHE